MNNKTLESYFESTVLPLYKDSVDLGSITWKDHGKVGPDAWAHYFDDSHGREYVLLYEDFPGGDYLGDNLTHDIVMIDGDTSILIPGDTQEKIENIAGYFTLYAERQNR